MFLVSVQLPIDVLSLRDGQPFFCAQDRHVLDAPACSLFCPGENTRTTKTFTIVLVFLSLFLAKGETHLLGDDGRVPGCVPITLNYYRDNHYQSAECLDRRYR